MTHDVLDGHYVYLYRDPKSGKPIYVGYGKRASRAFSHVGGKSHNKDLNDFLRLGRYQIDVVGPFGDKDDALRAETLLVSALNPLCNIHQGKSVWRFRPLGLPPQFADRRDLPAINEAEIKALGRECGGVLCVLLNQKDFSDGRKGYDASRPMANDDLTSRAVAWWQLAARAKDWVSGETRGPSLLLALFGPPAARFVVGAWSIAPWTTWDGKVESGGLISVPIVENKDLDAKKLRGRRLESNSEAFLFGQFRHQQFIIFDGKGVRHGGVVRDA